MLVKPPSPTQPVYQRFRLATSITRSASVGRPAGNQSHRLSLPNFRQLNVGQRSPLPLVHWTGPFSTSFLPALTRINRVPRHTSQKFFKKMHETSNQADD